MPLPFPVETNWLGRCFKDIHNGHTVKLEVLRPYPTYVVEPLADPEYKADSGELTEGGNATNVVHL
jgi:hypothetical protein